jgi:SAM-dependent methyltransferase
MTVPTFAARRKAWSSPPVDDIGYLPAEDLLAMDDEQFGAIIQQAVTNRYSGWRNWREHWTNLLTRWDVTQGKRILDYGCGIGLEGLILAKRNEVTLADITPGNLLVAQRAFVLNGHALPETRLISEKQPFIQDAPTDLDIILCLGVLHHIPNPVPVVEAMASWLKPGGELRLMVYSRDAFVIATGNEPRREQPVEESPFFVDYWTYWDAVGGYADWYDKQKLLSRFGEWFGVRDSRPVTSDGAYLGAVLVKR